MVSGPMKPAEQAFILAMRIKFAKESKQSRRANGRTFKTLLQDTATAIRARRNWSTPSADVVESHYYDHLGENGKHPTHKQRALRIIQAAGGEEAYIEAYKKAVVNADGTRQEPNDHDGDVDDDAGEEVVESKKYMVGEAEAVAVMPALRTLKALRNSNEFAPEEQIPIDPALLKEARECFPQ